jgi:BMFP domain-containing protein YqiC
MVEWVVDKALLDFASKQTRDVLTSSVRNVRDELEKTVKDMQAHMTQTMSEAIAAMRAEAETRANAMLQTLLERMSGMILGSVTNKSETINKPRQATTSKVGTQTQGNSQSPQVAKQTWANRFGTGTQVMNDWTTVSGRRKPTSAKKVHKKHPADQTRVLLPRRSPTQQRGPRDIMLAINKALAQEGADPTIRMVGVRYTKSGNQSGLTIEHARADHLLEYATTVLAAARALDPTVTEVEKTEKWSKLRVHGVALDRYLRNYASLEYVAFPNIVQIASCCTF